MAKCRGKAPKEGHSQIKGPATRQWPSPALHFTNVRHMWVGNAHHKVNHGVKVMMSLAYIDHEVVVGKEGTLHPTRETSYKHKVPLVGGKEHSLFTIVRCPPNKI
jgi:hypothetical protein